MMRGATEVRLGDVVELQNGYAFKSARFSDDPDGVPLIKGSNVGHQVVRWKEGPWWPRKDAAEYERFRVKAGDVVVAMDRPVVGGCLKYAWISAWEPEGLLVQRMCRLRANSSLNQTYLRYLIGSVSFRQYVETITTGANVPHISGGDIKRFRFLLPPLETQERLAEVLSAYDNLIENNNRRMELLEEALHLLFREWFIYLRFPGCQRAESVNGVPDGWRRRPAGEVIDFNPNTSVTRDVVRPYVPMASLSTTSMRLVDIDKRVPKGGAKFRNHDTLLARITPSLENGKTGFVDFLPSDEESATGSTEFIVMRGRGVPPTWVYCLARSAGFRQYAIQNLTGSDGRQRVSNNVLEGLEILVPPEELLAEWEGLASPMFEQVRNLTTENERLREARDLLLPRLMDGRIPV